MDLKEMGCEDQKWIEVSQDFVMCLFVCLSLPICL